MNYIEITYQDIIKKHGDQLSTIEKAINYRFYQAPIWDEDELIHFKPNGKVFRLSQDQKDTLKFDDLKKLIHIEMEFINRNFEMLREKCEFDSPYTSLAKKYHVSATTVQNQIVNIAKEIFNPETIDVNAIKMAIKDSTQDTIYVKINTDIEYIRGTKLDFSMGSARVINSLYKKGIRDLKELEGMKYSELLKIRDFGRAALEETISLCEKYNINLINDSKHKDLEKKDIIINRLEQRCQELLADNVRLIEKVKLLEVENQIRSKIIEEMTK